MKTQSTLILLIMLLSTACGLSQHLDNKEKGAGYVRQYSTTNNQFLSYIKSFEDHAKIKTGNVNYKLGDVPVNFGDTENDQFVGVCFSYNDGKKEVIIKASWWNSASQNAKESLIFHELGHCALNRDHLDEYVVNDKGDKFRASVMHPAVVSSRDYGSYYEGYVHELFTMDRGVLVNQVN